MVYFIGIFVKGKYIMKFRYRTSGVCSSYINLDVEGGVLREVSFEGGCNGNLKAVSALVEGMTYDQIKSKLSGIRCGFKSTSCPDQLVQAMAAVIEQEKSGE